MTPEQHSSLCDILETLKNQNLPVDEYRRNRLELRLLRDGTVLLETPHPAARSWVPMDLLIFLVGVSVGGLIGLAFSWL